MYRFSRFFIIISCISSNLSNYVYFQCTIFQLWSITKAFRGCGIFYWFPFSFFFYRPSTIFSNTFPKGTMSHHVHNIPTTCFHLSFSLNVFVGALNNYSLLIHPKTKSKKIFTFPILYVFEIVHVVNITFLAFK